MKNKGVIIGLIILISVIILFLVAFLVVSLNGEMNFKNGIISFGAKSNNVIFDQSFELEDIENVEIRQDAGDVIIKETTNDFIQVVLYGENENNFNVNITDKKLDIDYTNRSRFVLFSFGTIRNDIILYVPSSYSNEIKIKNDYGKCEVTDLENATVNIDCDCGDVLLGKIKNATIKCDYGNIEAKEILNKCNIKADCGNIEVEKLSIQEDSTIKADLGNVEIGETNDIYIDSEVDLGKTNINKNNRNADVTLKINCDCGNVSIGE